jgi:uncharacterized membrane protein YkgB
LDRIESLFRLAAGADRLGINLLRAGLIVVLVWIGALKVAEYEADGIVPFVANSPVMSFVYAYDAPEYRQHMNKEGELIPANRAWHEANRTYGFAYLLGGVIVLFGLLIAAHWWRPELGAVGSFLVIGMSAVTLSFLITTPESWVPALGDAHHGFPWLAVKGGWWSRTPSCSAPRSSPWRIRQRSGSPGAALPSPDQRVMHSRSSRFARCRITATLPGVVQSRSATRTPG